MVKNYIDQVYESIERPVGYAADYMLIEGMTIPAAVFLSQVVYWSRRDTVKDKDGWFHKQQKGIKDNWQYETGLTPKQQMNARKLLRSLGLIEEDKSGIPAKTWFRLNGKRLYDLLTEGRKKRAQIVVGSQLSSKFSPDGETEDDQRCATSVTNGQSPSSRSVKSITENTSQNTTERKITRERCGYLFSGVKDLTPSEAIDKSNRNAERIVAESGLNKSEVSSYEGFRKYRRVG